MKSLVTLIICMLFIAKSNFAQKIDSVLVSKELKEIYSNLEYNTIAFNDLKNKWVISDPDLIRELFNRFVVNNAIRYNGKKVNMKFIMSRTKEIYDGNVIINLRKRYYDKQIEYFEFISTNKNDSLFDKPLFDAVDDGFYLKSIIGDILYEKLQKQTYFFSNITKQEFTTKTGYYFDINLDLLEPEVMFWSTTSNMKNKYLVSVFGQWGSDEVYYPGWTMKEYFAGLQLTYYNELPSDSREYSYKISLGSGSNTSVPYSSSLPKEPFFKSGDNIFVKLSAAPFSAVSSKLNNLYIDIEGMATINEFKKGDFGIENDIAFNSLRNFASIKLRAIKLYNFADFGMLEASLGFAFNDVSKYQLRSAQSKLIETGTANDKFVNFAIGEYKTGGLIQHQLQFVIGYSVSDSYSYYGFKFKIMLSNVFGFDIRYNNSFGFDKFKYPWRRDSYLIFSPIIRINY